MFTILNVPGIAATEKKHLYQEVASAFSIIKFLRGAFLDIFIPASQ